MDKPATYQIFNRFVTSGKLGRLLETIDFEKEIAQLDKGEHLIAIRRGGWNLFSKPLALKQEFEHYDNLCPRLSNGDRIYAFYALSEEEFKLYQELPKPPIEA